jgi:class 3 adenylate cyclase
LKWSIADRCFSFSVVIILVQIIYLLWALYFIQHPEISPWLDHIYLKQALEYQYVYLSIWACLMLLFLWYKYKAPDSLWLTHLFVQSYFIGMALIANILGFFTSGFLASVGLSGTLIFLLIFQRHVVSLGLLSFFSIIIAATFLEQLHHIRYGPVYNSVPFIDGQLSSWFLMSHAFSAFVIFLVGILCGYHMIAKLHEQEAKINKANKFISRYISSQLSDHIFDGNYDLVDTHSRKKLTVFFSDIVGFTAISEKLEPEDLSALLNEYLSEMTAIANQHGGTIDKFVGDAIMIFFGAPNFTSDQDHAIKAVFMAIDMQNRLEALRKEWLTKGIEETFSIRIGINTGQVSVGNFGSEGRMDYTAIGRQVNLAARLESNCTPDKILISHSTQALINQQIYCQPRAEIKIKGVREPVEVYQVDPKFYKQVNN